ncbi:helix-turn-helix transcriptional regulator [Gordonia iterans]
MPETTSEVRAARTRAGLRQADLAAAVGVSRQTIVSLERGDYSPSVYLAIRIARTLDSTVEELFPLPEED